MAKIGIENIHEIRLTSLTDERTSDHASIAPEVTAMYAEKGSDAAPRTEDEALAIGQKNYNALKSSFTEIKVVQEGGNTIVEATIAPTRYLVGAAMRNIVEAHGLENITEADIQRMSPDMANVSLLVPVKHEGQWYMLAQIKGSIEAGDVLGSGAIHTGLIAGNVEGEYVLQQDGNPLLRSLYKETWEEMGIDFNQLDTTSFVYLVDERETGQVNFAAVARNADMDQILSAYEADCKTKLAEGRKLEAAGLALVPVEGAHLVPFKGQQILEGITVYKPRESGLEIVTEDRKVRPYTEGTVAYLNDKRNVASLLEKAA